MIPLPDPITDISLVRELCMAVAVGLGFLAILGTAEVWRRRSAPPTEWTRKFVHVTSGLLAMTFPWLFASHLTLLVLGSTLITLFTVARRQGWLRAVLDVERDSAGERWFPVGVYLLFLVGHRQPVFYLVALCALVISDTLAALLGRRYGMSQFAAGKGRKSLEGSAAFLLATFLGVHIPLLILTDIGRFETVMIAMQLALIATCLELIAERGSDNVIIPLAVYYLLVKMTPYGWQWIGWQLLAQLTLLSVVLVIARWNRFLSFAGAIAAHLVLYATFSLGSPTWTPAALLTLIGYLSVMAVRRERAKLPAGGYQVNGVFHMAVVAIVLLLLENSLATLPQLGAPWRGDHPLFGPFIATLAAPLAMTVARVQHPERQRPAGWRWVIGAVVAVIGVAGPGLLAGGSQRFSTDLALCILLIAVAVVVCAFLDRRGRLTAKPLPELTAQSVSSAVAALIVTPPYLRFIGVV